MVVIQPNQRIVALAEKSARFQVLHVPICL
jgi:hypothetical protein